MGGAATIDGVIHPYTDNFYKIDVPYLDKDFYKCINKFTFNSSEHLFQYLKCLPFGEDDKLFILKSSTPQKAWENGQNVQLRDNWEDIKIGMMLKANVMKFYSDFNSEILTKLKETKGKIVFSGPSDFWNYWNGVILEYIRNIPEKY
jgi:predicted NAD-dependent protein-ADP-ribosyltransferase YbiA (DUF1768 family)